MKLDKIIAGIKQNIAIRQKGVHADHVMVDRRELQIIMAHFEDMETELRIIHARKTGLKDNSTATEYAMCCNALTPQQNGGFPTEQCNYVKHQSSQPDIYRMLTEQNPEQRTEHRKPVTSFDWELLQAMNHLTAAISCTDDVRAAQLTAALNIIKGVSADD
ncbi:hypothetical protein [Rheinheimera sp. MMS21-TC3]|uniref:hypothetical protein n=1 Tax=Rheinheimera sp. MMS21-TC3 TaxID=3072790 RepID=UPI0028C404AC|nr:hypothetical protein [Rheinheimera sp. MMS21-TC3]WNO60427.1 hypothetical protein RDV63_05535 [Rheinheimera sp. MMS21-TC3]